MDDQLRSDLNALTHELVAFGFTISDISRDGNDIARYGPQNVRVKVLVANLTLVLGFDAGEWQFGRGLVVHSGESDDGLDSAEDLDATAAHDDLPKWFEVRAGMTEDQALDAAACLEHLMYTIEKAMAEDISRTAREGVGQLRQYYALP